MARDIWQKLPNHIHACISCHRDSEADGAITRGSVIFRLPEARDERGPRGTAYLRYRKMLRAIIAPREDAALNGIFYPLPDPTFAGTVVKVILMQKVFTGHLKHVASGA